MRHGFARSSRLGHALDAWRCLAALLVVVQHAFVLIMRRHLDASRVDPPAIAVVGNLAVTLFFVLSGYLVGGSVRRSMARGWRWRDYLVARGTRLWIVLLPAIGLGVAWDLAGTSRFPHAPVYSGFAGYCRIDPCVVVDRISVSIAGANAFFLQETAPIWHRAGIAPTLGSNFPLWSLSYEFWYYLLFPIAFLALGKRGLVERVAYAVLGVGVCALVGPRIVFMFVAWLLGAYADRIPGGAWLGSRSSRWVTGGVVATTLLVVSLHRVRLFPFGDVFLSAVFAVHLRSLLSLDDLPDPMPGVVGRTITFFAGMTYTLYLTHLPLLVFATAALGIGQGVSWGASAFGLAGLAVLLAVVYASAVWWLTERNTDAARKWIGARWRGSEE